jgi:hypothetical protein
MIMQVLQIFTFVVFMLNYLIAIVSKAFAEIIEQEHMTMVIAREQLNREFVCEVGAVDELGEEVRELLVNCIKEDISELEVATDKLTA